jgi:hypothetical protein
MMNIVPRPKGVKALDSITRNEYKVREGTLDCRKIRWYIWEDQQEYHVVDRYALVQKAAEVCVFTAVAAQYGCDVYSTETKQAYNMAKSLKCSRMRKSTWSFLTGGSSPSLKAMYSSSRKQYVEPKGG